MRKGTTLTKEMFLNHLYGGMDEPELKIIDVFICKLRKKLATASSGRNYIETVWGRGYVLREPSPADERIYRLIFIQAHRIFRSRGPAPAGFSFVASSASRCRLPLPSSDSRWTEPPEASVGV